MKILRWLGFLVVTAALGVAAVAAIARMSDGPIGPFAGGPLVAGELVEARVDWSFARELSSIEFQLLEPARSRTVWFVLHEAQLYIPCGAPNTFLKQWPQEAVADGRSILRVDGKRYRRHATKIDDPETWNAVLQLVAAKYDLSPDGDTPPGADDVWVFRIDPARTS